MMLPYEYLELISKILFIFSTWAVIFLCFFYYTFLFLYLKLKKIKPESFRGPSKLTIFFLFLVFLTGFAAPNIFRYSAHPKQANKEATINLRAIFRSQTLYFEEHNTYAGGPDAFDLLNWNSKFKENRYAYFCGEDMAPPYRRFNSELMQKKEWPYSSKPESSSIDFICMAVGSIWPGNMDDVWMINQDEKLMHLIDGIYENVIIDIHNGPPDFTNYERRKFINEWIKSEFISGIAFLVFLYICLFLSICRDRWSLEKLLKKSRVESN